ncbi:MAG TPA: hypothetical protein VJQ77_04325 [Novosphingobium sp.]|nr:hypothetical protein [Novosphingobium sp.]
MLTIAATKLVDVVLNRAHEKRSKEQFTTAMRAVVMGLTNPAEAESAQIPDLARATLSLWRVASPLVDALPDLSFDHRAKIGMAQMALDESLPVLANNAVLTVTNPGLVELVKTGAANLCLTILPVTELFPTAPTERPRA